MKLKQFICIIFVAILSKSSRGYKILAVFPFPINSHNILGSALLSGLAEAGHDVTMISPFTHTNSPKNGSWTDVVLTGAMEKYEEYSKTFANFEDENSKLTFLFSVASMNKASTENVLNHTNVQKLMRSGQKFDVVIVGQFMNDAVKAFAALFDAHLIVFSSVGPNAMITEMVGVPSLPSLVPDAMTNFPARMSFTQRLINTISKLAFSILLSSSYSPQRSLVKQYFPIPIDLNDVYYNVSLVLLNSHVSITLAQPLVPCMIDIGGYHVKPPKKLPEDLQSYLDNATEGVLYMSMGSIAKSMNLPAEKRDAILRAFGRVKQKVLWKWESDELPGKPPNVRVGKWLPQQDILAHPNVKLFITHGGLLSTTETVYHGVPVVAMPVFGDQKMNAYAAERGGYGLVLPFSELSEERLYSTIQEVLTNSSYTNEVQRRSRIMKDRQVDPLQTAVYWVEYVVRHKGAYHLRVPYLDLAWYQFYLLDVIAFILAAIVALYILLKKLFSYVLFRNKRSKSKLD